MSPKQETEERSPEVTLAFAGRWLILAVIGFQAATDLAELSMKGMPLVELLTSLSVAASCMASLWWPWIGLAIGALPLTFTLMGYSVGSEVGFFMLLPAVFVLRYGFWVAPLVALCGAGYGLLYSLLSTFLGMESDGVLLYTIFALAGVVFGVGARKALSFFATREVRLAILAGDVAEIRRGERLRLADELRTVVGSRLEEAWKGYEAPRRTRDAWPLQEALTRVQTVCLDAVTRVRGLVGMLREDPVAGGSDESLASIGAVQIISSMAEALRRQGIRVELSIPKELDQKSIVTQLTATRMAQLLLSSCDVLNPDPLRLRVEFLSGETRIVVEIITTRALTPEDMSLFARIEERARALGGSAFRTPLGQGQLVELRLPETGAGGLDSASAGKKKPLTKRMLGAGLRLVVLGAMGLWTCLNHPLEWSLAWAGFGYVSSAVMLWWPIPGVIMGIVAAAGMLITPEQTPVALAVVILLACWKFTRNYNPYAALAGGVVALIGLWMLSLNGAIGNSEIAVAVSMLSLGMLSSSVNGQYRRIRNRQSKRMTALMEAIEAARTEERNLLARELHDVLAHHFSVILLQCMAYGESDDAEEVRFALNRIAGSLEAAEGELFLLTDVMSDGEKGNLPALVRPLTVAERLQNTLNNSHFQADFRIDPTSDDLPQITRRTLTRAMQEGVTNIIRYADPGGKCLVELVVQETIVRLRVCNEMPENKRESKLSLGYGLAGIKERIDLSGGKFTAGPEDNQWVVTVELPNQESEAESVGGPSSYTR